MQQHNSGPASRLIRLMASVFSVVWAAGYAPGLHAREPAAVAGAFSAGAPAGVTCSGFSFPHTLTGADNLDRVANLRQAIECANANGAGADTILLNGQTVALPASAPYADYSGQTGLPQITSTINIRNGTLFHDLSMGGFLFRTFSIAAGGVLNLQNMVLSGASAPTPGGAFHNSGTVNVTNSTIHGYDTNNRAGVLYNASGAAATIVNSLLYDNNAVFAHAIDNAGAVTIVNSTFDKHTSIGQFGAILEGTGYVVRNSIFWNPGSGPTQIAAGNAVSDSIVKGGYVGGNNILNVSPLFLNEGGNDFRLQTTSPAINVGVNAHVPLDSTDVDGDSNTTEVRPDLDLNPRVVAGVVDLGAFEDQTSSVLPELSINDVSLSEGDAGQTSFAFTVSLSAPAPAGGVSFNIATADGSATDDVPTSEDSDYVALSLAAQTIPAGSSTYGFNVQVVGNTVVEADETFFVNVSSVTGATIDDGQGLGTILNDDSAALTMANVTQGENGTFTFSVVLNAATSAAFSVEWTLTQGTTVAADYVGGVLPTGGSLNFAGNAGETRTFSVPVLDDALPESAESFTIGLTNLSTAGGFTVNISDTATGTITDNDVAADFAVTTTATSITVTDTNSNGSALAVSEPAANVLRFDAPGRTFSVNGGPLISGNSSDLALAGITGITVNAPGGTSVATGAFFNIGASTFNSSSPITLAGGTLKSSAATAVVSAPIVLSSNSDLAGTMSLNGPISGDFTLRTFGAGTYRFASVSNTFARLNIGSGTVVLGGDNTLPPQIDVFNSASFNLNGFSQTIDFYASSGTTQNTGGTANLEIGVAGSSSLLGSPNYPGSISGPINLTIASGAGQTLGSNGSGYTGTTNVLGTLVITGTSALGATGAGNGTTIAATGVIDFRNVAYAGSEALTVNGGTLRLSNGNSSFPGPITLNASAASILVNSAASELVLNGVLSGAQGFTKSGDGTLRLTQSNTFAGPLAVADGSVLVTGSTVAASAVSVASGGTLGGTGTVGGPITVASGGTLSPGVNIGTLHTANVSLAAGATFLSGISGTTVDTQYDQLDVNGTVNLGGATLALSGAHVPLIGESFMLIDNDGSDTVVGTFAGLPQGGLVTFNGVTLAVSYSGGDGNDVVLSAVVILPTASVVSLDRASGNPRNTPTVTWTVTFSTPIDGLTPANFVLVSNGLGGTPTIASVTEASGPPSTQWNISASTGTGSGTLGINLINDSGLTHDLTNLPFAGQVFDIDRTPPTVTITVADANLSAGETSPVSFVFSEVVDQLPLANISVANGTLSSLGTADNITWTAVLTPDVGVNDATNVVTLDNTGSLDIVGNPGVGSTASNNYAINTELPTLSVGDVSRNEGLNGVSGFDVTLSLSFPAPAGGVSFDIATADGTATAGSDYAARSFTAQSIGEGESTYVLAVPVNGDAVVEADVTFFINISNVAGATIGDGQGLVTILNDDTAGISVSPTAGLVTTEAGATATFSVVLNSQPTANVAIGLNSSDATEGTVAPTSLTFSTVNWNVPQTVTVTGVDDLIVDGNVAYSIVTAPATSADSNYSGVNAADVSVSNTDNDSAGITVTPTTGLVTTEAGGAATFTVVLNSQPTANVAIGLNSSDATEGTVAPTSLSFSTVNWSVAQTVAVTGVDDAVFDGDVSYSVVTAPAVSADPNYSGIDPADVAVSNTDNDAQPVLSITSPSQPEGNASGAVLNFVVSLSAVSGQDVSFTRVTVDGTATVANSDYVPLTAAQATIPAGQLSISIPVQVNGDTVFEGDETLTLELTGISNATPASLSGIGTIVEDDQQPTTTTITSDLPDPSVVGQPYTVNVSVSGQTDSPLGTVMISDGSASCGPITLTAGTPPASSATCPLTSSTAGARTLTASYTPGSSAFAASGDSETHQVNAAATAISVSGPASTPINQPTAFSFALTVVAPGGGTPSGTVTLSAGSASCQVTVPTATAGCDLSFSTLGPATVSASYAPDDSDHLAAASSGAGNASTTVFARVDLQLTKTDADALARPGETVVYTLSYRNVGSEDATGVVLSETVPPNTRFHQAASSPGWSCADNAPAGSSCSRAVGTVAAGIAAASSTFALRVDTPLPAGVVELTNSASISDDGSNGADATPENNIDSEQTPVDIRPDLSVSKSTSATGFLPGQTVVYQLDYRNQGNGPATGVRVIETVPEGTVFVAASSTPGWSCADGAVGGTTCAFSAGAVPAGQQGSLAFAVTLRAGQVGGVIRNSVRIEDDGSNGPDPTPDNNASVVARPALGGAPTMVPASGLLGHLLLVLGLMMAAGAAWSRQQPRG